MEVLAKTNSEAPLLISNVEVMEFLQKRMSARSEKEGKPNFRRRHNKFEHRDWIEEHVHSYLQTTPCVDLPIENVPELKGKLIASAQKKHVTEGKDGASAVVSKPAGFGLTEAESVQILNFMPREPVEIHLMIEELHGRMSEKRQEDLLHLIGSCSKDGGNGTKAVSAEAEGDEQEEVIEEAEEVHTADGGAVKQEI
jgi:hypothetical protein